MLKGSDLISREVCEIKYSLKDLSSTKGKSYFNGIALKELFSTKGFDFTKSDIEEIVDTKVPSSIFLTDKECLLNKELLVGKLMRFKEYEDNKPVKRTEIAKANSVVVDIEGNDIKVDFHLILDNNTTEDVIEVIKFKNKKCDLKKKGRTIHTKISDSMELFLLQKAGEKLYPSKKVYGTIVFLTNSKDSSDELVDEFEKKENDNIVSYSFDKSEELIMNERVKMTVTGAKSSICSDCSHCDKINLCNYVHSDYTKLKTIPLSAKAGKVSFTSSQLEFINTVEGNYRVLAGAGSGKTTVIANRIVNLIKNGVLPQDILLITYTTKGVEELKEKISYWLSVNKLEFNSDDFNIFTFNSFGYELVKKEYLSLGFTKEPNVLDKVTKMEVIKGLLDKRPKIKGLNYVHPFMNLFNAKGAVVKVAEYFEIIKTNGLSQPEEVMEDCKIKDEEVAENILLMYLEYSKLLKDNNLVDFADQLLLAYNILSNPANVKKYGYEHIMVDEFQDTDTLQINTLKLLRNYPYCKSLIVVGDDAQSIFSWRGANQYNIINFHKFFDDVEDIAMEENFRSTKEICELANYVNNLNKDRVPKELISYNHGDCPVLIPTYKNTVETIVENIQERISNGAKPNDICIIARNKKELIDAQKKLTILGIPSVVAVSEVLIDNDKIKNILGYSNFLVDTSLDLHFAEYLQVVKNEEFSNAMKTNNLPKFIADEKDNFLAKYNALTTGKAKVSFFIKSLEDISKIDKAVAKLLEVCNEKNFHSIEDLNDYLRNLSPYQSDLYVEKSTDNYEAVTLTTAHSSKGREFDEVYVSLDKFKYNLGMIEEHKHTPEIEEERRLVFVAITRAKKNLSLVGSPSSTLYKELANGFYRLHYPLPSITK